MWYGVVMGDIERDLTIWRGEMAREDELDGLRDEIELLRSRLSNARNILHAHGFVYADELDREFPWLKAKGE